MTFNPTVLIPNKHYMYLDKRRISNPAVWQSGLISSHDQLRAIHVVALISGLRDFRLSHPFRTRIGSGSGRLLLGS